MGGTGGYHFEARPPETDCYLAWISGRANLRLDSITFHWRCPATDLFSQSAAEKYWPGREREDRDDEEAFAGRFVTGRANGNCPVAMLALTLSSIMLAARVL